MREVLGCAHDRRIPWLSVPGTARRSNQSIIKEIIPEYSLEGLMMKLKLQYFGHLIQSVISLEKTLMLGKTEGRRRKGQQKIRRLYSITNTRDMSLSKLQEILTDKGSLVRCIHGLVKRLLDLETEQQQQV